MNKFYFIWTSLTLILTVYFYNIKRPLLEICDLDKCPYCFGTDYCPVFINDDIVYQTDYFERIFNNLFSVKNVYFAINKNNKRFVLKKLAHYAHLAELDKVIAEGFNSDKEIILTKIRQIIQSQLVPNFIMCSQNKVEEFISTVLQNNDYSEKIVWTILKLNIEPLILQILNPESGWPVPKYIGACGRVIVQSDCGQSLNKFADYKWHDRAKLAIQLLKAAKDFTDKHSTFRLYLTDISPDNIAVDSNLKISFVDLGSLILSEKRVPLENNTYHSVMYEDYEDYFGYSYKAICDSSLCDHNYYAVCKLLLSNNAPWPMMKGGLLHTPPKSIKKEWDELIKYIELCVKPTHDVNRFQAADKMVSILETLQVK